jgi:hypothetical protein
MCKPSTFISQFTDDPRFQEVLFCLLIGYMVYVFLTGKKENNGIAKRVFSKLFGLIADNFSYLGTKLVPSESLSNDPEKPANDTNILEPDYPYSYRVYMTGRETIRFGILNIVLNRRQDFLSNLVYSIFWPEKDKIQLEFALDDSCSSKGVVYLVKAKQAKKAIEDFEDLRNLAKRLKPDHLNKESLVVFAESQEINSVIFDPSFAELLNGPGGDLVESIVITDCVGSEFHKGPNAKLVVNLGKQTEGDLSRVEAICSAFIKALDRYSTIQLPKRVAEEAEEGRKRLVALRNKQHKAESNDTAKSVAERYAAMTPAEKKKFEEKEARKAKAKSKMVKMVKGV